MWSKLITNLKFASLLESSEPINSMSGIQGFGEGNRVALGSHPNRIETNRSILLAVWDDATSHLHACGGAFGQCEPKVSTLWPLGSAGSLKGFGSWVFWLLRACRNWNTKPSFVGIIWGSWDKQFVCLVGDFLLIRGRFLFSFPSKRPLADPTVRGNDLETTSPALDQRIFYSPTKKFRAFILLGYFFSKWSTPPGKLRWLAGKSTIWMSRCNVFPDGNYPRWKPSHDRMENPPIFNTKYIDSFIGGFPMPVMLVNSGGGG